MNNPSRKYNLILLNKTMEDLEKIKKPLIESIYPKTTHMDFNIAAALHFASAGTKAKIVFTGLGADEIFSGYSRYRIAYKRAGYEEMENEMIFDMERLWIRNMGRDDRAIGMNGKEARFPFLYLPLWQYLRRVPLNKITEGTGEKLLLRKIAREFGLEKSSHFKKKAIQFGTRLAKLSNVKSFGSNRKAKGTYEYR
jgi:asparagine synthetase B (glutamine-hydrolysing)